MATKIAVKSPLSLNNMIQLKDMNGMDEIVSLCKRRGFIFPGSDIYGGMAGLYDFGPYGVELLNNLKQNWWKHNIQQRADYVGLDSAMFKNPEVWKASGHVDSFSDPMSECKECHTRIRVDKELEKLGVFADEKMTEAEIGKLFDEHALIVKNRIGLRRKNSTSW